MPTPNVVMTPRHQQVVVTQGYDGYAPASSVVYAGTPIRWVVRSTAPLSCPTALRAPTVGYARRCRKATTSSSCRPSNQPRSNHCAMGMYSGEIRVVPRPDPAMGPAAPVQAAGHGGSPGDTRPSRPGPRAG